MNPSEIHAVGYTCCYVPHELILAAGFRAERIIPRGNGADADGYAHPNTCCYARSVLADAVNGSLSHMEAVVLANSCDGMRKSFDLWDRYVDRPKVLFLDIPKKQGEDAEACFSSALKRLGEQVSGFPGGKPITVHALKESIRHMNEVRSRYRELFDLQKNGIIPGSAVFTFLTDPPFPVAEKISALMQEYSGNTVNRGRRKILITGNILNKPVLVSMIESGGGSVIGFDTCFGMRHHRLPVEEENPDPWQALARRYLSGPQCPRMMGIQDQLGYLKNLTDEMQPDGIVMSKVKFCDNLSFNLPLLQETMEASGVRCLVLENDYEWSDPEKMRIKVEAFLEMME